MGSAENKRICRKNERCGINTLLQKKTTPFKKWLKKILPAGEAEKNLTSVLRNPEYDRCARSLP